MHNYLITCFLLYLAVFSGSGAKADIQCHECIWTDPDGFLSSPECYNAPETTYLPTYESPVTITDSIEPTTSSNKMVKVMRNVIAAVKGTNSTTTESASLIAGEQETNDLYQLLCITFAAKGTIEGETYYSMLRTAYPVKNPHEYRGKCLTSLPPRWEKYVDEETLSYYDAGVFCYCDTDACNNKIIQVPGYDNQ